jgi:hypothetical protein
MPNIWTEKKIQAWYQDNQWWLTWWSTAFTNCIVSPHQHSDSHVPNTCQVSLCDMQYVSTKLLWTLTNSKITSEMGEMFSKMCLKSSAFHCHVQVNFGVHD